MPITLSTYLAILSILLLSTIGCVSGPQSVGDSMTSRLDLLGEYGDQWKKAVSGPLPIASKIGTMSGLIQ